MKKVTQEQWEQIVSINKELDELYSRIATHYKMSDSEFWILYSLYNTQTPLTQREICDCWSFKKQTINSAIKALAEKNLVKVASDPTNSKSKLLELTTTGRSLCRRTVAKVMEAEDKSFALVNTEELNLAIKVLGSAYVQFKEQIKIIGGIE